MRINWELLKEAVGFSAVAASLIFVGLEIQQNTAATRGQTRQELTSLNQEWLILLATDREFNDLWLRAWISSSELDPDEIGRAEMMMVLYMRRLENVFLQYQEGLTDEVVLRSYGFHPEQVATISQHTRFKEWWSRWNGRFHPDFVAYFEAVAKFKVKDRAEGT